MEDMKVLNDNELEKVSGGAEAIDPFLPGTIDYAKETLIMENKKVLNEKELEKVVGGAKTTGENDDEKISIEGLEAVGPYSAQIPGIEAQKLGEYCYEKMFQGENNLTNEPKLP